MPESRALALPPKGHQPTKAEKEEEMDMPKLTKAQLRKTFPAFPVWEERGVRRLACG